LPVSSGVRRRSSVTSEADFFRSIAARKVVRPRVAGIVIRDGQLLAQRPTDDPQASYALVGGEYEVGDTFMSRLQAEIEEETSAHLVSARYLFVIENRFIYKAAFIHGLEHYLLAEIDRSDVESREPHLEVYWLPVDQISNYDLRPHVVRDAIASGKYLDVRHLVVPFEQDRSLESGSAE